MDARRVRILIGSMFSAGLLMSLFVAPVSAACALNAPESVAIGSPLHIDGSGFPASATVDVAITIEGGSADEFTLQSDGTGAFTVSLTPEAADTGLTTVVASTGPECTAQAIIAVGVDVIAEPPEPTDAGSGATAPRTDLADAAADTPLGTSYGPWLLAGLLFLLGVGGLYATRPPRGD